MQKVLLVIITNKLVRFQSLSFFKNNELLIGGSQLEDSTLTEEESHQGFDVFSQKQIEKYYSTTKHILEKELRDPNNHMQVQDYERILRLQDQRMLKMIKELSEIKNARSHPAVFKQKIDQVWINIQPKESRGRQEQRPKHMTDDNVLKLWTKDFITKSITDFQRTIDLTKRRIRQHTNFVKAMPDELKAMVIEKLNDNKRKVLGVLVDSLKNTTEKLENKMQKVPQSKNYQSKHARPDAQKSPLDTPQNLFRAPSKGIKM